MREKEPSKACSLFIVLTVLVGACTHSPTKPNIESNDISVKHTAMGSRNEFIADFIVPPINVFPLESTALKPNASPRLIWEHIRENLALSSFYEHPRVVQQRRKYLNKRNYLSAVTRQSKPFIHFVLDQIEQREMPAELVILPIVESSYFPTARSRAKAVGLWQFMSHTAKELGLQQTRGYDGRHDVYASTIAALDYLTQLHTQFNGDWLLALAAYNAGPHRITRAQQLNIAANKDSSFWNLLLPRETHEYVPKILALSAIVSNQKLSSTLLHPIADEPYLDMITVNKRITAAKLARTSGIDATQLRKLNPALQNMHQPIPKDYNLLVPKHATELLVMTIDTMPEETPITWNEHSITRGESLSVIAKRYGTSVSALKKANNLPGNTIVSGRTLLVPTQEKHDSTASHAAREKLLSTRNNVPPYFYVVAMGDSYWKIASRNNTTVDRLMEINGRNPNQPLRPGESILID